MSTELPILDRDYDLRQTPLSRIGFRILAVVFLLVSPTGVFYAAQQYSEARESVNWPITDGTIADTKVEEKDFLGRTEWIVTVRYRYAVDGRNYTSERLESRLFRYSTEEKDAILRKYPDGSHHEVRYSPTDPKAAFLEPGAGSPLPLVLASLALPALALALLLVSFQPDRTIEGTPILVRPGDTLKYWGAAMIGYCFLGLLHGGPVLALIMPILSGIDTTTVLMAVLIPIGSVGLLGAVVFFIGFVQSRRSPAKKNA